MKITKKTKLREVLQFIGTDLIRNNLGENVWVNALFADYVCVHCGQSPCSKGHQDVLGGQTRLPNWCITDTRFPNEAEAIKSRGGLLIRVNRANTPIKRASLLQYYKEHNDLSSYRYNEHPSETSLDHYQGFDEVFDNNGSIEELVEKVKLILIKHKII